MSESSRPVRSVEVSVFSHATEDEEKVKQAVLRLFPEEAKPEAPEETRLTGHYDDPITSLTYTVKHRKEATDLFTSIAGRLSSVDATTLLDELADHVDPQGNLYIRLDKQAAYTGAVALQDHDPVRVKVKLIVPHKGDPVEVARGAIQATREEPQ